MARAIARVTRGTAALTTASEVRLGLALDEPPPGWRVANPARAKALTARLLTGGRVTIKLESGSADWLTKHPRISLVEGGADVRVTDRAPGPRECALVLHPPVLALGVGTSRNCPPAELAALVRRTLNAKLAPAAISAPWSPADLKMDEPAVDGTRRASACRRDFPGRSTVEETPRPPVALGGGFSSHRLLWRRRRRSAGRGRAPGRAHRRQTEIPQRHLRHRAGTTAADAARIEVLPAAPRSSASNPATPTGARRKRPQPGGASDIVSYGLYLDLGDALQGKRRPRAGLGAETERVRLALDLAVEGRDVALVSSGDAGIYGLASLVFELVDRTERPDWRRLTLSVVPGISALQAAAARVGAPLGHDFAVISLSDLLTPWAQIERRLAAAARGDFVLALYNPRSQRRRRQLEAARRILLRHRRPDTPVVLARNLGREGEQVTLGTLARFDARAVDMLTLILVGSRATRVLPGDPPRLYTPRGYRAAPP